MSNTYTKPSDLVSGTTARASDINDRASATETGFDNVQVITHRAIKLPVGTSGDQFISESSANRANKEVGFNASGVLTLISSAFQWKGNWATSTAYIKNDTVRDNSTKNIYAVLVDHTSGTLSSDVSASKLALAINVADVETAKSAAQTAQAAAETAETNAETAESNAETAESNAASSATASANSATAGANSATAAANSATAGANSATAGANSATAGANSATAAANSASTASTQATNSSNSATAGANSATAAASSASTATTKANQASASASTASTQATNASNSATASANSATAAANSASGVSSSATGAANSATAAAASFDSFDDRYLGAKNANVNVDNDGNSLITGALYFNSTANSMRVYNGSSWQDAGSAVNGTSQRVVYTATANQTTFSVTYDAGFVDVYLNGIKLLLATDFTGTSGTNVVLATGATVGDIVDIVSYGAFNLANTYTQAQTNTLISASLAKSGGAMTGPITTNSTFDGVDIATRDGILTSTTATANAALPKAGGILTGAITTNSTFDGRDVAADGVTADAALPKAGGTVTGLVNMSDQVVQRPLLQDYSEKTVAMGSATAVNLEDGNVFSKTISGTTTLTFTNPSSVGTSSFSLILTNGGSATLNFPTVKWPAATAPTLTASGIDVLVFVYHGSTWYGIASGIGMA